MNTSTKPTDLVSDAKRDELLAASPAERVTLDYMKSRIVGTDFVRVGQKGTICVVTLDNGFEAYGESACADPANYNQQIGERNAYDDALRKLWPVFGFRLCEINFLRKSDLPNHGH